MRRVNTRGIEQANKHMLMAALTYNLKKYLNFIRKKNILSSSAEQKPAKGLRKAYFWLFRRVYKHRKFTEAIFQ
jgi:hypothetical protein